MRSLNFLVFLLLPLFPIHCMATDLYCEGLQYMYPEGFGSSYIVRAQISRLIKLDKNRKTMTIESNVLGHTTSIRYKDDGKIISSELPVNKNVYGSMIHYENINIDQYTGGINTLYMLDSGEMWVSFEGKCSRANKRF